MVRTRECMRGENLTEKKYGYEREDRSDRGMKWLSGVTKACNTSSLELRDAKTKCLDGEQ